MASIPPTLTFDLSSNAILCAKILVLLGRLSADQCSGCNTHDPGFTILEHLWCCALMVLAYCSPGLIVDLLALAVSVAVPAELEVDPALVLLKLTVMGTDVAVRDPPVAVAAVPAGSRRQAAVQQQGGDVSAGGGCRIDRPPNQEIEFLPTSAHVPFLIGIGNLRIGLDFQVA